MKAFLLAAGRGARLRPLTDTLPKCLVPIGGRPLLDHWLALCERHGVRAVLVNGHWLADQVEEFLDEARGRYELEIEFVREPALRGTGGTLRDHADFVAGEELFLACHADGYTDADLSALADFHRARRSPLTLSLFRSATPERCGIVLEQEDDGRITRFAEKPKAARSNLASAAIFALSPAVLHTIPAAGAVDFSAGVLPHWAGAMYGIENASFVVDVGTPESYAQACALAERRRRAAGETHGDGEALRRANRR